MKHFITIFITLHSILFKISANPMDSINTYFSKASYFAQSDYDSMLYYANKIKNISINNQNQKGLGIYNNLIGVYLEENGLYDSSLVHTKKALYIFEEIKDSTGMARSFNNIGTYYMDQGIYDLAIENYTSSLTISERIKDYILQSISANNIGFIYYNLSNLEKSEIYHLQAKSTAELGNDSTQISNSLLYLGNMYVSTGKYDEAIENFNQSLAIYKGIGDFNGYYTVLGNMGTAYFFKNELKKAIEYYNTSAKSAQKHNDNIQVSACYQNIGEAYIYLKEFEKSEKYLNDALDVSLKIRHLKYISNSYLMLYTLFNTQKNYKQALDNHILHIQYKDSIFNKQQSAKIAELDTKYQTAKKAEEINNLTSKNKIQQLKIKNNQVMLGGISGVAILLIISLVALYSRKNYKLKANMAREKEAQQKLRFKSVIEGEEKERKRIAQDLHDGLGQLLSTARLNMSVLEDEIVNEESISLNNSLKLIDDAVSEVRNISHNMMPNALISIGFEAALKEQVHLINDARKIKVNLKLPQEKLKLEETQAISLYRIIQEILNNALKYAKAENINISIEKNIDSNLTISIKDDGKGFDTKLVKSSSGIGWENIISRTDLLNGTLDIQSTLGKGSEVLLKLAV